MSTRPRNDFLAAPGALAGLMALALGAGCGGSGDVSGKVTYKGKAVASGAVLVFASDQLPYYAEIQKDGSFAVAGVPRGEALIGVNSPDPKVLYAPVATKLGKKLPPASPPDPRNWFPLPAKAGDPTTSGLTATIVAGPNVLNLDLKDD